VGVANYGKRVFKTCDKINMLVYYLGFLMYQTGAQESLIVLVNMLGELYEILNAKDREVAISEVLSCSVKIKEIVQSFFPAVTSKVHSLLHYVTTVISNGLLHNFSGFTLESYFGSLKKVSKDCKKQCFPALKNCLGDSPSVNLFSSLDWRVFRALGVEDSKADFFLINTEEPRRRPAFTTVRNLSFCEVNEQGEKQTKVVSEFKSFTRTTVSGVQWCIESYSRKFKTNNNFGIFLVNGNQVFANIKYWDCNTNEIYYSVGSVVSGDAEKVRELFLDRFVKLTFSEDLFVISGQVPKQAVAFKVTDFYLFKKK
jgi:hypothetical protein